MTTRAFHHQKTFFVSHKKLPIHPRYRRQEVVRREGERGARRREAEVRVVEREARLERLRRTARRRLGVHIMPHVPDRYAFPTKVTRSFISSYAAYK
jgi:hypothetical protein